MKLPRPRITIRRMMLAVAILAVCLRSGLWVVEMRRLSKIYSQKARDFVSTTMRAGKIIESADGRRIDLSDDENSRIFDTYALLKAEKYWRLAAYPWMRAEPDSDRPSRLANPRSPDEVPPREKSLKGIWRRSANPPAWTFLRTSGQ